MQIQFEKKKFFKMAEDIRQLLMLIELLKAHIKLNFISDKDKNLLGINPENPKIRKVIEVRCDKLL